MRTDLLRWTIAMAAWSGGVVFAQETAYRANSPANICVFEAARLYPSEIAARGGRIVDDPEATSGGKALEITPYKMEAIYFGFVGKQPPVGECVLKLRIKISDSTVASPAFYLAAYDSNQRDFPLNQRLLTAAEFSRAKQYQEFSLRFIRRPNQPILAAMVWKGKDRGASMVTVDTVTMARCEAPLGIGNVRADRLWYRRGAEGVLTATVANHYNETQPPPVQEGISIVGVAPSPKATCTGAWVLSPDTEPFAATAKTVSQSGQVTVALPKLRYWSVVVLEWNQ